MTPHQHTSWQVRVRLLLRAGYGVEDIAIKLGCDADQERAEVHFLRQEGRLADIVRPKETIGK